MNMIPQPKQLLRSGAKRLAVIALTLGTASAIGFVFREIGLPETDTAVVYLLAVLLATLIVPGYGFGCLLSVLSAFCFNYLFTEPYFSISAHAPSYIITFVIMTATALIATTLVSHAKLNERRAQAREEETRALHTLTSRLIDAADMQGIASIAADAVSQAVCANAGCLCFNEQGVPDETFIQRTGAGKQIWRDTETADGWLPQVCDAESGPVDGPVFQDWPIRGREGILGVVRLPNGGAQTLDKSRLRLLRSMIESIALAMDRLQSAQLRLHMREEAEQERYRSNLLRSISHDLRTPLSGILGTTEILLETTPAADSRYVLIEGIHEEAGWLAALVENILNLTRLQDGRLTMHKRVEAVEEVVGEAVAHITRRYPQYDVAVHVPDYLLLVPMDAKLIGQVLVNLLDNAIKHTEPSGDVSATVAEDATNRQVVFTVQDTGCGINETEIPHIFEMFYTSRLRHADARQGIGLGLAICEAIVHAHGGTITAHNRTDRPGAVFRFTLPLEGDRHAPEQ